MSRRFPKPWTAKPIPGGWCVNDAIGQTLVYVYGRNSNAVRVDHLTMDEARRIAVNVARLPDLLRAKPD